MFESLDDIDGDALEDGPYLEPFMPFDTINRWKEEKRFHKLKVYDGLAGWRYTENYTRQPWLRPDGRYEPHWLDAAVGEIGTAANTDQFDTTESLHRVSCVGRTNIVGYDLADFIRARIQEVLSLLGRRCAKRSQSITCGSLNFVLFTSELKSRSSGRRGAYI